MHNLTLIVPKKVDTNIQFILEKLQVNQSDISYLKYSRPLNFEPEVNNCHLNVLIQQRHSGGCPQHGWIIFKDRLTPFYEAIFHTVWRNGDGRLLDVTPRADLEKRLMFAPDFQRKIKLTHQESKPAIDTFQNVKTLGTKVISSPEVFTAVIPESFPAKHGLWPW